MPVWYLMNILYFMFYMNYDVLISVVLRIIFLHLTKEIDFRHLFQSFIFFLFWMTRKARDWS